jgi:Transposase DDE domain
MSDTHRRYSAIEQAVRQVIPTKANSHREKQLSTLTALICGIVGAKHTHLPKVADQAPSAGAKRESRITRFERFVSNRAVSYETFFLPHARALLSALVSQPLALVMDGSSVGRGCVALLISVVYYGRALPLAWLVVKGKKGHFPEASHCALLALVEKLIPLGATVVFLGDGEFDGIELQAKIQGYGWQYVCRTASSTLIWCGGARIHFSDMGVLPDDAVVIERAAVTAARYGPVLAVAVWAASQQAPLYLVSNLASAEEALRWYRLRFRIETFFSDQKSRGFQIDKSHLGKPERLSRLLLAACLAYLWIVYLGRVAEQEGWLPLLHRTNRCDLSLFQLGLSLLAHCLNEDLPVPVTFRLALDRAS